ncbi:hypothetical protein PHMEG_00023203 [Phytophthora megakarya]|uniref:Bzip transcription factor n=1 Tax=Phytophthora megakarya TaxID=4795 RepID=A0A225VHL9_9STRA|nr:hypothetical protein PHMEG_00023203 [Phytophthora megakarya]
MESNIRNLHDEIKNLQLQRVVLSLVPTNKTPWSVVVEYFRLFRFGVNPSATVAQLRTAAESNYPFNPPIQRDFLAATMTPDVTDGTVSGIDAIMRSWKHVSLCFNGFQVDVKSLENGPDDSVIVTTKQHVTITENMLKYTFPHLIDDSGGYSHLATKLLRQQILIRGSVHFKWNSENGRVTSFLFKADMVTPILHLLHNLEDVSDVFRSSRLTPECGVVTGL